jgi:hypothetical protein
MSADAIDAIARMMSESRCRGKFRGLWRIAIKTIGLARLSRAAQVRWANALPGAGQSRKHRFEARSVRP